VTGKEIVVRNSYLDLPTDFEDYGWEVEAKGWFSEARIVVSKARYRINFYDLTRLNQQIQTEFEHGRIFFEPNLVIVQSVTLAHMEKAAEELVQSGQVSSLLAEELQASDRQRAGLVRAKVKPILYPAPFTKPCA
jgi:hypothetical protein